MSFMYTHSWFHAALFYLEDDDYTQVQHAYEQHIWRVDAQPSASRPAPSASASSSASPSGHIHVSPAADERPSVVLPHEDDAQRTAGEGASLFQPFLSSDKGKIEDQLSALLVLWKWQVRCSAAQPAPPAVDFAAYYRQLLSSVKWPPAQTTGLYGLVLLQACASAGEAQKAGELRRAMQERVDAMVDKKGGQEDRKRAKHTALYLPVADALLAFYGDNGGGADGKRKAYQLVAPVMTTYHSWLHRNERKQHSQATAAARPDASPAASKSDAGGTASWQSAAFPWSGRHLLQVVVGSGEQRSALSDWWLQLLYEAQQYAECEREAEQWLAYRRSEGGRFYMRMRDASRARRAEAASSGGVAAGGKALQQ